MKKINLYQIASQIKNEAGAFTKSNTWWHKASEIMSGYSALGEWGKIEVLRIAKLTERELNWNAII